jgi:BirA family biotin operon repressor/biotin-[acetyl-CoA-carboxylase] ligase
MYWRLEQGPAAAIGLSLVIGIVMAEVLQARGWVRNGQTISICRTVNCRDPGGTDGENWRCCTDRQRRGYQPLMRRVESDVVNQGWVNLQEAGVVIDRNTLAVRLINELRSALSLLNRKG